jgi:hypothetical protein
VDVLEEFARVLRNSGSGWFVRFVLRVRVGNCVRRVVVAWSMREDSKGVGSSFYTFVSEIVRFRE